MFEGDLFDLLDQAMRHLRLNGKGLPLVNQLPFLFGAALVQNDQFGITSSQF